jgi:hypothetical protein
MESTVKSAQSVLINMIERVITNAKQRKSYLFIGRAYDVAFDKAYEKLCYINPIDLYNVMDKGFRIEGLTDCCASWKSVYIDGRVSVLRLKNKANAYQTKLLAPLERLVLPLLVFVDNDSLTDTFMSRFKPKHVYKVTSENLKATAFIPPDMAIQQLHTDIHYSCPSLIKLGDYSNLSVYERNMDMVISRLSNGKVYPEVLTGVQPPIKTFDDDIKLEALSLLKNRYNVGVQA